MVKKGDIVTVIITALVTALLFLYSFIPKESLTAYIYADGNLAYEIDFKSTEKPYTVTVGSCVIEVTKEGVSFKESLCPDKLCEKSGKLSLNCDTAACIPNKVVILIKGNKNKNDTVTY